MIRALTVHMLICAAFLVGCLLIALREPFGVVVAVAAVVAIWKGDAR